MSSASPQFNARASTYDTATPIQSHVAQHLAQLIIQNFPSPNANLPEKSLWLDLGCGTGKLSQAVLDKLDKLDKFTDNPINMTVYGIDNADKMLQAYQNNLTNYQNIRSKKNLSQPNIHTHRADIATFQREFPPHSVDIIMSSFALHWVTPDSVKNWGNLLKSSGQIHVAIPVLGSLNAVQARFPHLPIYAFAPEQDWQTAFLAIAQQGNGRVLYQQTRTFEHSYRNLRALLSALKTMGGTVKPTQTLDTATLRHYLRDDKPIALDYQVLLLGLEIV